MVAGVGDGEVLGEHLVKAFVCALFGRSVEREEVLERLQLHLKEVGAREVILYSGEINAWFNFRC